MITSATHTSTAITVDANEAVASVAYRTNEVIAVYPITPASPMGEYCDEAAARGHPNLWGQIPRVVEMQSEAGAAGALHGALQAGALATTFTGSQGLLLMIPNLYKIAGELNAFCMHVAARTVATHALSIFGDHSDVMACRQTGMAMLCSASVQEAHDFAVIGQAATLESRVPLLHFFDGFRTSHEVAKIVPVSEDDLRRMLDDVHIAAHRERALTPDRPLVRGTAQNPDVFFQAREACNPFYEACAGIVEDTMKRFAELTGRVYQPFEYFGDPEAEWIVVVMGSASETVKTTVEHLVADGHRVGVVTVRLFRPFAVSRLMDVLPRSVRAIAVLDRTKEPGAIGEPLYLDVVAALHEAGRNIPIVLGGRYGLGGKEFTPAMAKGVLDHLDVDQPSNHFTVGIADDLTGHSIAYDPSFSVPDEADLRAVFYGLGADGTVGANKATIKIVGKATDLHVQGYFVYDSKKAGARTASHLRFGARPIRAPYLIQRANFVAVHQFAQLERHDLLSIAEPGSTLLLNAPFKPDALWDHLSRETQEAIIDKKLAVHVIDASALATEIGLGNRINTIMQVCFFALSGVMETNEAVRLLRESIIEAYARKGDEIVRRNLAAIDRALDGLHQMSIPDAVTADHPLPPMVSEEAPDFVKRITATILAGLGDALPTSAFTPDGTWPVGTARWEKRDIATQIPVWEPELCIQCNQCALVCPHAAIRAAAYEVDVITGAPESFPSTDYRAPDLRGLKYTLQVAPEDCTGCNLCVTVCPAKDKAKPKRKAINMVPQREHVETQRINYEFFQSIPPMLPNRLKRIDAKGSQFLLPLFEYSGACGGCGETPYIKLLTQLFGDRLLIANATGCSSIYGGNLPTTPYTVNADGRGPAWSNSLFEDNAEFGLGFRLALNRHTDRARGLLGMLSDPIDDADLINGLRDSMDCRGIDCTDQRDRVDRLTRRLANLHTPEACELEQLAGYLVGKSVWLVGGDGWAYDIGFGGLDHVIAGGEDVNILVLDTEVYSNTGGQQSKATPLGAAAKFASVGKGIHKKDLGLLAMSYGHAYVASIAFGANENQTVKALLEAESYRGPSLIIAYSHCIAHGYDLCQGAAQQKRAVECGIWPLYRFDPRRASAGEPPLQLDCGPITGSVRQYMANEARFRMVESIDPQRYRQLVAQSQQQAASRVEVYRQLAEVHLNPAPTES